MKVKSSNVAAILKDKDDLCVEFKNGKCYRYFGAGVRYFEMLAADSKGVFLNTEIKGPYDFAPMSEQEFADLEAINDIPMLVWRMTGGKGCYF
jgi:hypothetical protein